MISKRPYIVVLTVIVSMTFAVRSSNNMFSTTVPLLAMYNFHFTDLMVGLLSAVGAGATFIMSAMINSRLHSGPRRLLFLVSSFTYMVIYPLFYFSNYILIWPLVIIAGFVLGSLMPNIITSASLLDNKTQRERLLSIYTLTLSLSLIAGPTIESEILLKFSLIQSFLFFTALPVVAFISSFYIQFPEDKSAEKIPYYTIFKAHGFKAATLNILTYNIPFALILTFGGIYAKDQFGVSYSVITLIFSLFFTSSFLSRLLLTIYVPTKIFRLMTLSVIVTTIGLIALSFSPNIYLFAVSFLILGLPHGFTYPLSIISISRGFEQTMRSVANSYFFSLMMIVGALMPVISGFIVGSVGFRIGFVSIVPVVVILYILLRKEAGYLELPEKAIGTVE
ncbi:Major Facilitator Superfamily protein [Thermoplasmatales archaeon]|nr:Major Facilitator Superfamily protein [Thermoplasmatales archaeon]